jgi:UDP-N-acetylmuramoyl-L-alanyl-D-glutamate--2,6-diaminopimelate ligase
MKMNGMNGRLIAVYGCAGHRDFRKRPMMGQIGVQHADLAVFTAEDPRTEDVWSIIRQMKEQLTTGHDRVLSIADREQAIHFVINTLAKRGDLIALLGKGPEKSMCYGTTEYPWSERTVVEQALAQKK